MPQMNDELHGFVPEKSSVALVLVDVVNDMEFTGGAALFANALPAAQRLARLVARARVAGVPVVFVNDNFGRWRSDFRAQMRHVIDENTRGAPIARLLCPDERDYFVLKAKSSAFYHTQLDLLFRYLGVRTIVLAGFATDICVLLTAADAHMRDLQVIVPRDCSAAQSVDEHERALVYMARVLDVTTPDSEEIDLAAAGAPPSHADG